MENKILISAKNLSIGHEGRILCSHISFEIFEGDCIMLCGANGSGKTTLLKAITSSDEVTRKGEVIMIPARIPKISGFTLREFIRISCFNKSDLYGRLSVMEEENLDKAISELGLSHLADRDISTLSDGEFQKGALASALVRKASVILLDEPTSFLDAENRINVLRTLRRLCDGQGADSKPAIIFSTHDLHDGLAVCTKVYAIAPDGSFHRSIDRDEDSMKETVSKIFKR